MIVGQCWFRLCLLCRRRQGTDSVELQSLSFLPLGLGWFLGPGPVAFSSHVPWELEPWVLENKTRLKCVHVDRRTLLRQRVSESLFLSLFGWTGEERSLVAGIISLFSVASRLLLSFRTCCSVYWKHQTCPGTPSRPHPLWRCSWSEQAFSVLENRELGGISPPIPNKNESHTYRSFC